MPAPTDPVLRQWVNAIRVHDAKSLEGAQSILLAKASEYRETLETMSRRHDEPRVRAFAVTLVARMIPPPGEAYFVERLSDPVAYPRLSALAALERLGSVACLTEVDRLAGSDPDPGVRKAAIQAAKAVRSR